MGNSMGRAVYEANVPDNFRRPQTDSALESFIRAKYETKKYIAKEWVPQPPAKIDWEKEIDEEEKQKKKKKATTGATTTGVPIIPPPSAGAADKKSSTNKTAIIPPPLPKIGNLNSPKSNRTERKSATNGSSDLLGLNTSNSSDTTSAVKADANNDNFANFLSASPAPATVPTTDNNVQAETKPSSGLDSFTSLDKEEADFFNQTAADKEKSGKMTKDSILALYGSAPINPINNFNQGFNGVGATPFSGMPPTTGMPGNATGMFAQPNAFAQLPPTQQQQQQQIPQQYPNMMNNQFVTQAGQVPQIIPPFGMVPTTMSNQWGPMMGQQPPSMQPLGAQIPSQMFNYHQPNSLPNVGQAVAAPPTMTSSDSIAKQFGSLNLNNVWQ